MKYIILLIIGLLIISIFMVINLKQEKIYQGPVRPTDDEVYFRKTGITKTLS